MNSKSKLKSKTNQKQFIIKKMTMNVNDNFTDINDNIKKLLIENEKVIINYLEKCIYTSNLSEITTQQINSIFINIDSNILLSKI